MYSQIKAILVGYPGSQHIVPASRYLTKKYLPFKTEYLNYTGDVEEWSQFLHEYISSLPDKEIILALDDYLISGPVRRWPRALRPGCVKLCYASEDENEEYPVTTQYTLWKKPFLLDILSKTKSPWDFEIQGSAIVDRSQVGFYSSIPYNTSSCLSRGWEGVKLDGLNDEDLQTVKELIYGKG